MTSPNILDHGYHTFVKEDPDTTVPAALATRSQEDLAAPVRTVPFASGRSLEIAELPGEERIHVHAPDGQLLLSLRLTPEGPVLALSGLSLEITAQKHIALACKDLSIRTTGDANLDVGGSLHQHVRGSAIREAGKTSIERAREVKVEALLGSVVIHANDDVDIKGERVRLNSDDPPMPLTWEEHRERQARKLASSTERPIELALPDPGSSRPPKQ
jgi:hypothetical protein